MNGSRSFLLGPKDSHSATMVKRRKYEKHDDSVVRDLWHAVSSTDSRQNLASCVVPKSNQPMGDWGKCDEWVARDCLGFGGLNRGGWLAVHREFGRFRRQIRLAAASSMMGRGGFPDGPVLFSLVECFEPWSSIDV